MLTNAVVRNDDARVGRRARYLDPPPPPPPTTYERRRHSVESSTSDDYDSLDSGTESGLDLERLKSRAEATELISRRESNAYLSTVTEVSRIQGVGDFT